MEILNKYYKIAQSVVKNEMTIEQYFETYKTLMSAEGEIKAELSSKTVKVLRSVCHQLGQFTSSTDKKDYLIKQAFDAVKSYFFMGRPVSYVMGLKTYQEAEKELIEGTTAEFLAEFYAKRKARQEQHQKALENPQTLEEFRIFIDNKGKENLTPEQLSEYEKLLSDVTLSRQQKAQEVKNQVSKVDVENVEFEIYPTKHSKTGAEIFTVLISDRVEREKFNELKTKAKQLGGYYSRYTDKYANPPIKAGFNFDNIASAEKFCGLKEQDQDASETKAEAKAETTKNVMQELEERAKSIIEKGQEELNRPRQTNTHRRAAQAASAEKAAQAEISFGKTLLKLVEAYNAGNIKYLHALRNGKQLEQLQTLLSMGKHKRLNSLNLTYTERQNQPHEPLLDVNFVAYPFPKYYGKRLLDTFEKIDQTGCKKAIKHLSDYILRNQDKISGLVEFREIYDIKPLKEVAAKIRDNYDKNYILDEIKNFERVQKMGLTNDAILKTALRELVALKQGTGLSEAEKADLELRELERSFVGKKIDGFFPTPTPLIQQMFAMVSVEPNDTICEPSAGLGHIAEQIRLTWPENDLKVIEVNHSLSEVLKKKNFDVDNSNFLSTTQKFDVIIMNPPFEKNQDIDHVKHAFSLLNGGGRLVAIMAGNKNENSSNKKIAEFLEMVSEFGYMEQNEEGSFKSAFNSTNVNTVTVYLEKPASSTSDDDE